MWCFFWFMVLTLTTLIFPRLAAAQGETLYHLVTGGQEVYHVEKKQSLNFLALEKGLRPWVLAKQTKLKVDTLLKPGTVLKFDTTHIVPTELTDGLVVNLPERLVYQFYMGVYQRRYAIAVGKKTWQTPTGLYKIVNKEENPTWTVPVSIQEEMEDMGWKVLEKVPPGPKNPLGKYWIGTSGENLGFHATNAPWSVGHAVSHGCMRMLPSEIAQLYPQVSVGDPVKIIYQPVKMALTPKGHIYLEAHPNIYDVKMDYLEYVKKMARSYQLESRIDWRKVDTVLKIRSGLAHDVTKESATVTDAVTPPPANKPRKLGLFPLQVQSSRVE
jgi:L,D-transpeptidase ErfK/SrfK